MASSGLPDETRAGRRLLKDYVDGKILYYKAPPGAPPDVQALAAGVRQQGGAAPPPPLAVVAEDGSASDDESELESESESESESEAEAEAVQQADGAAAAVQPDAAGGFGAAAQLEKDGEQAGPSAGPPGGGGDGGVLQLDEVRGVAGGALTPFICNPTITLRSHPWWRRSYLPRAMGANA